MHGISPSRPASQVTSTTQLVQFITFRGEVPTHYCTFAELASQGQKWTRQLLSLVPRLIVNHAYLQSEIGPATSVIVHNCATTI